MTHAATVSEGEVPQNKGATQTVPAHKSRGTSRVFVDKKLQRFFAGLKREGFLCRVDFKTGKFVEIKTGKQGRGPPALHPTRQRFFAEWR